MLPGEVVDVPTLEVLHARQDKACWGVSLPLAGAFGTVSLTLNIMILRGENKGFITVLGGNSIMNMNVVLELQYFMVAMQLFWWEMVMSIFGLA